MKCNKCKQTLDIKLFSKNRSTKSGYSGYCKICMKSYKQKWRNTPKRQKKAKLDREKRKQLDWFRWKAHNLRGTWRDRAKKSDVDLGTIPELENLILWLKGQQPFVCAYSGVELNRDDFQIDHKTPVSRGGSYELDNIVVCSKKMNMAKGALTQQEFYELLNVLRGLGERTYDYVISRLSAAGYMFGRRK